MPWFWVVFERVMTAGYRVGAWGVEEAVRAAEVELRTHDWTAGGLDVAGWVVRSVTREPHGER